MNIFEIPKTIDSQPTRLSFHQAKYMEFAVYFYKNRPIMASIFKVKRNFLEQMYHVYCM